ncbi:unnamed protein product [Calypogeia fissa]
MAVSGTPSFPSFFTSFSRSLSTHLRGSKQQWKALGTASALTVGVSLTVSRASSSFAEEKARLEKALIDGLMDLHNGRPCNRMFLPSIFASLSLSPPTVEDFVEPKTGVVFPGASPEGKQLTGIGLRKKRILGLKSITVYAYGLYADPDSLKTSLSSKYESVPAAELGTKEELFDSVTKSDVGLTVRLVIVYGKLKIGSIRNAFEESVGKGLKKFSGDDNKELLKRFTSIFTDDLMLPKGTTIDITRLPGQILQTKIDGQEIGSVQSSLLCHALFDLYIGEDAFDRPAREAMGRSFASIISGS